jgi:hypothetical protein
MARKSGGQTNTAKKQEAAEHAYRVASYLSFAPIAELLRSRSTVSQNRALWE